MRHYDATGHIDHHLVQFDISNNSTPPNLIGHLSVHIYHGTRLIQIQCPKQVPDGRTAALWFTNEVLFPLFKARAKAINFNSDIINQIHQAILGAPPDSGQACSTRPLCFACSNRINKISASIKCPTCSKVFHKQKKCSDHVCTPSSLLAPPDDLNPLTPFPDQHVLPPSQSSPSSSRSSLPKAPTPLLRPTPSTSFESWWPSQRGGVFASYGCNPNPWRLDRCPLLQHSCWLD